MTTEDDFQKLLDANPDDHNTRLVFADWLQERDGAQVRPCPRCRGSREADAVMHVGPIVKPIRVVPIGKQPCHLCEDDYGDPTGEVAVLDRLRAVGYRALGRFARIPERIDSGDAARFVWTWVNDSRWLRAGGYNYREELPMCLPLSWHRALPEVERDCGFATRRAAEDAAALAFSLIPLNLRHRAFK